MKPASEMPFDLKIKRDKFTHENWNYFNTELTTQNAGVFGIRLLRMGFDKCFELMSEREAKLKAKLEKAIVQRNEWHHRYASATKENTYAELIKQNEEIEGVGE